jgi:hydrogenase maturation protease
LELVALWSGKETVLVINAVRSGANLGTIYRLDVRGSNPIPASVFGRSTDSVSLAEAVELARALRQLPRRLILFGVEGEEFALGSPMTPAVSESLRLLVDLISEEITKTNARHYSLGRMSKDVIG